MNFATYCQNKEKYDEAFLDTLQKSFKKNYGQAQKGSEQDYEKYADIAKQALAKAGDTAKMLSQKTGVPLPLATALVAAGMTGGPTAIPFAALLYFVKQPLMKGANKAFDATWDAGSRAVQGVKNALNGQAQPQLQPESFRAFIEADSWGDWAGQKLGGAAGTVAGTVAGYGSKIAGAVGGRIKEIAQFAKNNPKEVARFAFLVGAGAAIGAGVGKITHEVKDLIVQSIKNQGIDPKVLDWVKHNIVLDKGSGESLTSKGGEEVHHPYHINDKGHRVNDDLTVAIDRKTLDGGLDGSRHAYGNTISTSSSGGTENLTRVGVSDSADTRDAYRDAARALQGEYKPGVLGGIFGGHADRGNATSAMIQSSPTPLQQKIDIDQYGHGASEEIAKRLAAAKLKFSPDNYTAPSAMAGAAVGGTGNRRN